MTDTRVDVPADDGAAPIDNASGHSDAAENVEVGLASCHPAQTGDSPSQSGRADAHSAEDVPAGPAPPVPTGTAASGDPGSDRRHDPDRDDPVPIEPGSVQASPATTDPVRNDQGVPGQHEVELTPLGADPVRDSQVDPAQVDPAQADPAQGNPVQGDPARGGPAQGDPAQGGPAQVNPAQADPAQDDQVAVDQAQPVPVTADSAAGGPAPTVPATPPLREPDEAALRLAEAAVFASATPMTPRALSQILPDDLDAAAVIAALRARYEGRGLELCEIGGGLQFRTAADLAPQLRKVVQVPRRLPRVALETLAIVAYHQPITRPEIEDLRGTGLSQQTLDVLLENDLIAARGRKETPGRPTLWGTTAKFLEYFGLRDIRELPRRQDLLLEAVRPEAAAEADVVLPEAAQP